MAGNVLSWGVAINQGYEPRLYPYVGDEIPVGEFNAKLDFKIWAKQVMGICCYFTHEETGIKFQLTVYCKQRTGIYKIDGCEIDFTQCPVEHIYHICVVANEKKRIIFKNARLISFF